MGEDGSGVWVSLGKLGICEVEGSSGATSGMTSCSTVGGSIDTNGGGTSRDRLKGVEGCSGLCGVPLVALPSSALITGVATSSCLLERSSKRRYVEGLGQMNSVTSLR